MTKIKLILTIAILSAVLAGCIKPTEPVGTPVPTPTATLVPTVVPTYTPIPTPTLAPTPKALFPLTYKVWIDSDYGFRLVRAINGTTYIPLPSNFDRFNFAINVGDKVIWINDDSYDFPLTIISNEGLWDNKTGYMRYNSSQFGYTFNKTGTYTVYIKEYRKNQQNITVNP
ncbi:MAG TPA: hypothetical protein VIO58_06555 [Candidatus Methanoperedens sp.]